MLQIFCLVLDLFFIAMIGRIILSFFPIAPGSAFASIYSAVYAVTEPVLGPLRRVLPSVGMFDLSPIVVFIAINILQAVIGCGGGLLR